MGEASHEHAPTHLTMHPPAHQPGDPSSAASSLLTASGLEGSGGGFKTRRAQGLSSPPSGVRPPSRPPLTLRQRLEVDLAPVGAVARSGPSPHLEAVDVPGAQLPHSGHVGLTGQGEGLGFIFCLGVTATHSLPQAPAPHSCSD